MIQQTVIWTALPKGAASGAEGVKLMLSAFASIRLWTDEGGSRPTLSLFPDFLHWPNTAINFSVQLGNDSPIAATRTSPTPRGDLWQALFSPDTYVRPSGDATGKSQDRFDRRIHTPILSYPVANIQRYLRDQYGKFAISHPEDYPAATALLQADALQPITTLGAGELKPGINETALGSMLANALQSNGAVPASNTSTPWDFFLLKKFHEPLTKNRGSAPEVPPLDFHQAISLLGDYPIVLRLLGLVYDLELLLPERATPPGDTTVQVLADWIPSAPNTNHVPNESRGNRTRCHLDRQSFYARSRESGPEITPDGTLKLGDASTYELIQVDTDGAAIKLMDLANNLVRSQLLKKTDTTPEAYSLPSLRSAGISVVKANHAKGFHDSLVRAGQLNQQLESPMGSNDPLLDREDLTRGFAIDVWDSETQTWHSLCERVGTYQFPSLGGELLDSPLAGGLTDEGWVSVALTSSADGSVSHAKLHESVARWWGWSLAASRPGMTAGADGGPVTPANDPATEFKMKVSFRPARGSLPRLRFGVKYRLRARAVDLAGNRTDRNDPALSNGQSATAELPYGRFEPLVAPTVVFRQPRTEGESLERIVIRSNYNTSVDAATERHLAPPKADKDLIETHGLFDLPNGAVNKLAYAWLRRPQAVNLGTHALASVDQWEGGSIADIGTPDDNNAGLPYVDLDSLKLPYLPDPLVVGALFRGLPGKPDPFTINFDGNWPQLATYRLTVKEGSGPPVIDPTNHSVTVFLPKAEVAKVRYNSLLSSQRTDLLGLLDWVKQIDPAAVGAFLNQVNSGTHWMVTPYRTLTLVHAVRQPLLAPAFTGLSALRSLGDTFALLTDEAFEISQKSTSHVDINASWTEWLDPLDEPRDRQLSVRAHVFQQPITPGNPKNAIDTLPLQGKHEFGDTKYRKVTYTASATTRFSEYFKETKRAILLSSGVPITLDSNGVVEGSETVRAADGSGSFALSEDYTMDYATGTLTPLAALDGQTVNVGYLVPPITRETTQSRSLDILNSARPAAPKVLYVVPTFGWSSTSQVNGRSFTSARTGRGLRVYLDRPWWSSGEGELLGVVLWGGANSLAPDHLKPYVTQWGTDPIFQANQIPLVPALDSFELAVVKDNGVGSQLSLDEITNAPIQVAGHEVGYDEERRLWYGDILVNLPLAYSPFIRLALARYQPKSLKDAHLSRVVLADFAQLTPDRSVSITRDVSVNPPKFKVTVSGIGYQKITNLAGTNRFEVSWEERSVGVSAAAEDLAWAPVPGGAPLGLTPQAPAPISVNGSYQWTGTVTQPPSNNPLRLVIKEFEIYNGAVSAPQRRLVFADAIQVTGSIAQ